MVQNGQNQKEQWGSRIGVILAVAGSAVGLGNFLRFPGQAAQYGGGAFMIPYFIALVLLGIPLSWAEWTMGRFGGLRGFNSAPGIFRTVWKNPGAKYVGGIAVVIPLVIYMYYVVIEAWCLGYAWFYLTGELMMGSDPQSYSGFFDNYVGVKENGFLYSGGHGRVVYFIGITFVLNFVLIYRGLSKGIETFCRWAIPLMAACALCVLVRVFTLPAQNSHGVIDGLAFMWEPKWEKLANPECWLAAAGQIFFSLSVGFGVIVNYSSYLSRKDDVALSGLTASSMNEFFEVCLGGMITLPAAVIFLGTTLATFGTFGLGFNVLPNVFALMPAGRLFGFLWFFMLFLAAITSSLSMLQPVIAFLEEGFALRRQASVTFLGMLTAIGSGFVIYFSKGMKALDVFDFWIGSTMLFVLALIESILYGWVLGIDRGEKELHEGAHIRIPRFVQYILKYVTPVYLLIVFAAFCWNNLPSQESVKFSLAPDAAIESMLEAPGETTDVPDRLKQEFTSHELKLPDDLRIVRQDDGPSWVIKSVEATTPSFVIRRNEGEISVASYTVGRIESITSDADAFFAMGFIVIVLVFNALLVHLAERRWLAEGRFDNLEK